jgi:hypothetical protein
MNANRRSLGVACLKTFEWSFHSITSVSVTTLVVEIAVLLSLEYSKSPNTIEVLLKAKKMLFTRVISLHYIPINAKAITNNVLKS